MSADPLLETALMDAQYFKMINVQQYDLADCALSLCLCPFRLLQRKDDQTRFAFVGFINEVDFQKAMGVSLLFLSFTVSLLVQFLGVVENMSNVLENL